MRGNRLLTVAATSLSIIICLSSVVSANSNSFKVTSYIPEKFTDFQWRVMGGIDLSGNESNHSNDQFTYPTSSVRKRESLDQSFDLNSTSHYKYITRSVQFNSSLALSADFDYRTGSSLSSSHFSSYADSSIRDYDDNARTVAYSLNPSAKMHLYPSNNFFVSLETRVAYRGISTPKYISNSKEETYYPPDYGYDLRIIDRSKQNTRTAYLYDVRGEMLQGIGRVEYGVYGATALYIIDELESRGLISHRPSYSEMNELADRIYWYRESRPIDRRVHRMESFENICVYLESIGTIDETSTAVFIVVADVLDYFPKNNRPFGFQVGAGAGLSYSKDKHDMTLYLQESYSLYNENESHAGEYELIYTNSSENSHLNQANVNTFQSPYWIVSADYHYPIDIRWQLSLSSQLKYYFDSNRKRTSYTYAYSPNQDNSISESIVTDKDYYGIEVNSELDYIINSRSNATFRSRYACYNRTSSTVQPDGRVETLALKGNSFNLESQFIYRITIPTTLNARLGYSYTDSDVDNENTIRSGESSSWSFSARLEHYLF